MKKQSKHDGENAMPDVGVYPDASQRAARSRGYAAGYDGQPDDCPHPPTSPEALAWRTGYNAARKAV